LADTRKEKARVLLEGVIDALDSTASTTALLYKAQQVACLLDLPQKEASWIDRELLGYPDVNFDRILELLKDETPMYRAVRLVGVMEVRPLRSDVTVKVPSERVFFVHQPTQMLENCSSTMELSSYQYMKEKGVQGTVLVTASLAAEGVRGIVYGVRGRVGQFAAANHTSLLLEASIEGIVRSVRSVLAERLARLNLPLLELLEETVTKQEQSTDPVEWRNVVENLRTIVRRFTTLVLRDDMVPAGTIMPNDNETRKKTELITQWIRRQTNQEYDSEAKRIDAIAGDIDSQQMELIDLIDKKGHEEMDAVAKGEVDRIVLATVLWMADLAAALGKAAFKWTTPA